MLHYPRKRTISFKDALQAIERSDSELSGCGLEWRSQTPASVQDDKHATKDSSCSVLDQWALEQWTHRMEEFIIRKYRSCTHAIRTNILGDSFFYWKPGYLGVI